MNNAKLVILLRNVAAALTIKSENRFRIIAYEKAADAIEHLTSEVKDVWEEGKLEAIPGVGPTIAAHLDELFKTGKVKHFEKVFDGISPAFFEFLLIPGIGPKKAFRLTKEFNLNDPKTAVEKLKKLCEDGKIATLEGFGETSQKAILSGIDTYSRGAIKENRMPMPFADKIAQELIEYLKELKEVRRVDILGSLRRRVATIGDIDMAVVTDDPKKVVAHFVKYPKVRKITDQGEKGATVLLSVGRQVDLRVQDEASYGAMLQYFTGSKHHNIKLREYALKQGLSLSEHGIKLTGKNSKLKTQIPKKLFNEKKGLYEFKDEKDFYHALGMDWIPPQMREDAGEVDAAIKHQIPTLVELSDIKGDLHIHSNYDLQPSHDLGASSLEELLDTAASLKYSYIGISDHNPSVMNHSDKQVIEIMKKRYEVLKATHEKWQGKNKKNVELFVMCEVDMQPSGTLALPDEAFEYLDACLVSLHSSFAQSKADQTTRILNGLSHPKAKIFAHPTARLLGERDGVEADWPKVFEFVKENNKALEINSWPQRLDLPDLLVREAIKQGVQFVIDTDSHAADHMFNMQYGVDVARRGWSEKSAILNTLEYNKFKNWLLG